MTRLDTTLPIEDYESGVQESGPFAGHPTVTIALGSEPEQDFTADSFVGLIEGFGWRKRLKNGGLSLRIVGQERDGPGQPIDPCFSKYSEPIAVLCDIIQPREVHVWTRGMREPSDAVVSNTSQFVVRLSTRQIGEIGDGEDDVIHWFARHGRRYGNVTFLVAYERRRDEKRTAAFSNAYTIADEDIWLHPEPDALDGAIEAAKRNRWRVSPRLGLVAGQQVVADFEAIDAEFGPDDAMTWGALKEEFR